jgi:alcohol dehydrogenase
VIRRVVHASAISIARLGAKLLPDRIPVTFAGPGSSAELGRSIRDHGASKVLVVTDEVLNDLGIVATATASLAEAGVDLVVYDEVRPDPTFAQVERGHRRMVAHGCDAVLAVGGGSPIDAAKVIAAMATNGGDLAKLEGKFRVRHPPAPLFAVPTTAGTGSEVTIAAVVSETDSHRKRFFIDPKLLPTAVALDPELMTGIPAPITAATGMDALTHAIESYVSRATTPRTESWATTAVRLVFEHLPVAVDDGNDLEARTGMALASYYAGLAFTRTSVGYVHAIAHNLGARYGTPHGLANALVLPHVLEFSRPAADRRLAELGDLLGVPDGPDGDRAGAFIDAVRALEASIGIPTTLDSLEADDIGTLAEQATGEAFLDYPAPRFMTRRQCEQVIEKLLPVGPEQASTAG